jgi:MoxR-like ATPase
MVRRTIVGISSPRELEEALPAAYYLADEGLSTAAYLALALGKPLLLEGAPGVGKTEAAKAIAGVLGRTLLRLQCYEGIDAAAALYEWNFPRQMLALRQEAAAGGHIDIYKDEFLIERPMLTCLRRPEETVLLIDEIDRSDEEFEAFLLELLSDFQVSIPEIGTIKARQPPIVVITSNRTREIHDAVKRRCLYHWVDYPDAVRELEILRRKAPGASDRLSREVVAFVQRLRGMDLFKLPGVAETIDWSKALVALDRVALDPDLVDDTLGALLKYQDDIARVKGSEAARILSEVRAEVG